MKEELEIKSNLDYIQNDIAMGKNNYLAFREQDPYSQTETQY
jgi:hypothetical protein